MLDRGGVEKGEKTPSLRKWPRGKELNVAGRNKPLPVPEALGEGAREERGHKGKSSQENIPKGRRGVRRRGGPSFSEEPSHSKKREEGSKGVEGEMADFRGHYEGGESFSPAGGKEGR